MGRVTEARTDLRRYLHVRSASEPSFTHDGERIAYLTSTTGVPQVWSVPAAGGLPEQHTFHDERISQVACDPVNDRWIFSMDRGGNERTSLHLLEDGGATEIALTDDPETIHVFGCFSHDGSHIAYAANDREAADFDVFVRPLGPRGEGKPRRLVRASGTWMPVTFSPDGRSLLVSEVRGSYDQDLYLVDLETGERRLLTARTTGEAVAHLSPVFTRDGRHLFLLSNRSDDFLRLFRLRLEDLAWQVVDAGGHDVEALAGGAHEGGLVYARNVGGISELHHLDPETGTDTPVEDLPKGSLTGLSLSTEGRRAAIAISGDTLPGDVYVVALPDGAPRRATFSARAGITADALTSGEAVHYESFDGRRIEGFLYRPHAAKRPACIVWVHGGPEGQYRPCWNPIVQYLVARGYAVFAPNVRGSMGYGKGFAALDDVRLRPDSVTDLEHAARWLASRDDIDGRRLAVIGGSYGGYMVLSTLSEAPSLWAAGVDVVGIANLVTFLENTGPWRRRLREVEYGSLETDRDLLEQLSPIHKVEQITAPLMVIHGANDPRVPVGEAEQIVRALRALDRPVEYLRYGDEGHGIVKLENRLDCYPKIVDFLDRHLRA